MARRLVRERLLLLLLRMEGRCAKGEEDGDDDDKDSGKPCGLLHEMEVAVKRVVCRQDGDAGRTKA